MVGYIQININTREKLSPILKTISYVFIPILLLIFITYFGVSQARLRLDDIDPAKHALATRPDQRATNWIRENTSLEDRILVNSFFAYGGSVIAGSDGGWWLPLLTQRMSTQPPLNYGIEEGLIKNYEILVNNIPKEILENGLTNPRVMEMLEEQDIRYIYIGQQQGRVNSPQPLLDNQLIQTDPHFQLVYHRDLVWIYKINY
jgi:hypothetical protein